MKLFQVALASLAAAGVLFGTAWLAQATTVFSAYNTTIGKYGGAAYTGTQTKTIADQNAEVRSSSVGGNYSADVCIVGGSICIGGTKTIDDLTPVTLWNVAGEGAAVRAKFTDGVRLVNVQVTGRWRADKV